MILSLLLALLQSQGGTVSTQQLLDMAPPGAVVRVSGHGEALTIRKPVTLLGGGNFTPSSQASITLDGPGSGSVSIVAMTIEGTVKGGGFDELRLERTWPVNGMILDGFDYIELSACSVSGPLEARGATVVATGSTSFVTQSNPAVTCAAFYGMGPFPLSVDAQVIERMPFDLLVSSPARPGGSVDVVWHTPGPIGFLYMAEGLKKPTPMPGANFGFNHLGNWTDVQLVAVERCSTSLDDPPATYVLQIPPGYDLLGRQFAFQVYDPPAYYSAPAVITVR